MISEIKFLKELQEELNTQDNDSQAAPRFWVVMDYRTVPTGEGYNSGYEVYDSETIESYADKTELINTLIDREESFIVPNTMFLTKAECKKHIEKNAYHYTSKAHSYAMTAWRSPKVDRLLNILSTMHWDYILELEKQ